MFGVNTKLFGHVLDLCRGGPPLLSPPAHFVCFVGCFPLISSNVKVSFYQLFGLFHISYIFFCLYEQLYLCFFFFLTKNKKHGHLRFGVSYKSCELHIFK